MSRQSAMRNIDGLAVMRAEIQALTAERDKLREEVAAANKRQAGLNKAVKKWAADQSRKDATIATLRGLLERALQFAQNEADLAVLKEKREAAQNLASEIESTLEKKGGD